MEENKQNKDVPGRSILTALAAFQDKCPPFVKNIEGFGYTYTGLPEIIKTITPLLRELNLIVIQTNVSDDNVIGVHTVLTHIPSGESLESEFTTPIAELKGMNLYQSAGSAITYARRYDMSTLLGLVSEKDDDGGSGRETKKVYKKRQEPKREAPSKKELVVGSDSWNTVVKYLSKGGKVEWVYKKFDVDETVREKLVGVINKSNAKD